jgi:hypothetical protein
MPVTGTNNWESWVPFDLLGGDEIGDEIGADDGPGKGNECLSVLCAVRRLLLWIFVGLTTSDGGLTGFAKSPHVQADWRAKPCLVQDTGAP